MKTLLAGLLALSLPAVAAADTLNVVVVPFAPLGGDVPKNAGAKAAEVLATTLKTDGLAAKAAGSGEADDPAEHLKAAQQLLVDGRKALDAGDPHRARASLEKGLEELAAGAAALEDVDLLADTHASLARADYQCGDDAKGLAELDRAEALAPGKHFAEVQSSPLFAGLAAREQKKVWAAEKARLKLGSIPPGAAAHVDGLDAGRTPVLVRELPPGAHLWRVDLPSGGSVGGIVEVAAGAKAEVTGAALGKGPASKLVGELAANTLAASTLIAMKDAAGGLDAQFLVFGGLHVEGGDLVLDSFVYSAKQHAFARLPGARFDPDLVSAGTELAKVANDVAGRANSGTLGVAAKVPEKVSANATAELVESSEFRFPAPGDDQPKKETGPRRVVGAHHGPVKPSP